LGTDEEAIAEILTTRSRPHLNAVFEEFKQVYIDLISLTVFQKVTFFPCLVRKLVMPAFAGIAFKISFI
jgi:hypothetical protein